MKGNFFQDKESMYNYISLDFYEDQYIDGRIANILFNLSTFETDVNFTTASIYAKNSNYKIMC